MKPAHHTLSHDVPDVIHAVGGVASGHPCSVGGAEVTHTQ